MAIDPKIIATPGKKINLKKFKTGYTGKFKSKKEAEKKLEKDIKSMQKLQDMLYAHDKYSLLLIFQAMDAAGKDGTIKHVMSGVNPQGCQIFNFKKPSAEELDHDYLWRIYKCLPERGRIGIFNRSYYEEVLIAKVHPEVLLNQQLPGIDSVEKVNRVFWKKRYDQLNNLEQHLHDNGTIVLKFFLNVSSDEQKRRFLSRIDDPDKNWKFTINDITERKHWDKYQKAFEDCFTNTSTKIAPWYIIPADNKWYMRTVVGDIIVRTLKSLPLKYPKVGPAKLEELKKAKALLVSEK
ncbi:MAG TPA: polyphosphate kinase 2 family protein [Cyclobacteriaceae bacterium]|nr:polyphosphate kinase 2 family protein [Cyclobacteriaceae bacterium]